MKIFESGIVPKSFQNFRQCSDTVFHEKGFSFQLFIWLAFYSKMRHGMQDTENCKMHFWYCIKSTRVTHEGFWWGGKESDSFLERTTWAASMPFQLSAVLYYR